MGRRGRDIPSGMGWSVSVVIDPAGVSVRVVGSSGCDSCRGWDGEGGGDDVIGRDIRSIEIFNYRSAIGTGWPQFSMNFMGKGWLGADK